ncbi:GNAT family N-acetyltransferase, partial [candidate division WOR-3 bacterium]|nr:GNAT family N-acetyltransferase [candidate division WOR-3 bacterium]
MRTRLLPRTGSAAADSGPESLRFRAGCAADRDAITGLFREAFGRRMERREWEWRFLRKPAGRGLVELAWDGTTLAGHYAVSPVRMRVRGNDVTAALSGTTMTHARYRGVGLLPLLARRTYARARQAGQVLAMGFPNKNSHRGLVRDLRWRDVYEVPRFSLHLGDRRWETEDGGVAQVLELERFDRRFDRLWDEVKDVHPISVVRDRRYLQWRFVENPESEYRIFAYEDGRRIRGYAVAKRYGKEMHIVDILCLNADTG